MRFYDKVNQLCINKGISITALAMDLGFSKGTPTNWKTMTKPPRAENIKKIADYFGVSVDYLTNESATLENSFNTVNGNNNIIGNGNTVGSSLTEHQKKLLELYNQMDIVKQAQLLAYAAELTK